MDPPPTQYIDRDGAALAYQVIGDGPPDVVWAFDVGQHLGLVWTDPDIHSIFEEVALFSRSVLMQRRGFGLSDQISYTPTIEQQADDLLAVMDAVGIRSATLVGYLGTCGAAAMAAASAPERVDAVVLMAPIVQELLTSDEHREGWSEAEVRDFVDGYRHAFAYWGSGEIVNMLDPVLATPYNQRLMALIERSSATPAAAQAYLEWALRTDIRELLRSISVPVRVLSMPSSPVPDAAARYAAALPPLGSFRSLPPTPRGASIGQWATSWIREVEEVATGASHSAEADRFLGTVLFTDVVSSTELLERVGDATYRQVRTDHERKVRLAVETGGGRLLTVTGDGTLSVFDSPTKAVRCAEAILRDAEDTGITVRAGIHAGELERDAMNVTGLTVHIGARVGAAAEPGQVLVSRTVRDLVAGSGLTFASRGEHQLKGVSGTWELFAVTHAGEQPQDLPREESMQTPMDKMVLQTARTAPAFVRAAVRLGNAIERRRARA